MVPPPGPGLPCELTRVVYGLRLPLCQRWRVICHGTIPLSNANLPVEGVLHWRVLSLCQYAAAEVHRSTATCRTRFMGCLSTHPGNNNAPWPEPRTVPRGSA